MVLRARCEDRQGGVGAGSASRPAVRRTPPQEHLRVRDAGHRRRAALRLVRRQRRRVLLLARRQAAVEAQLGAAADLSRLRHRLVAGRPRRAASISCTTTTAQSFLAALDAKTGKELWNVKRTDRASRMASGWATPFVWTARAAHRDRDDRPRLRDQLRHRRPRAVAAEGHDAGDAEPGRRRRPALRRLGIAGRSQPSAARGSPGRQRRHLAAAKDQTSNDFVAWLQPRFSGYTPSPLVYRGRVYAVNDNGILQVADAKTGAEIYKARVGGGGHTFSSSPLASQGPHLPPERRRRRVRAARRRPVRRDRQEQPRRDEPRDAGSRRRQPLRADADQALSHSEGAPEAARRPPRGRPAAGGSSA